MPPPQELALPRGYWEALRKDSHTDFVTRGRSKKYRHALENTIPWRDQPSFRRGLDMCCGRGAVTIAALQTLPNVHIHGVDLDSDAGYASLTDEERKRATFVETDVRDSLRRKQQPFDLILVGFVEIPEDFDYESLASSLTPNGVVIELPAGQHERFDRDKMRRAGIMDEWSDEYFRGEFRTVWHGPGSTRAYFC